MMEAKQPFEKIVEAHGATVLRVCRAVLGPHDADDAWQETFISALRAYPDLPASANIEAWLVTIAHRKAIDAIRAAARRPIPREVLPEEESRHRSAGLNGTPERTSEEVWGQVKRLPPKQRQVIAYRYLAGIPYAEIAAILGGTPEAARRAASDGLQSLRSIITESFMEGDIR